MWGWRRLLRIHWIAMRSNQSTLKKINPEYSLEGLMLKLQYFGYLMQGADSLEKNPDARKDWRQKEKRVTENEMVGWHHWLNGHEFEEAPEVGDGQGSLACCSPQGLKESDMTEQLNQTELKGVQHQASLSFTISLLLAQTHDHLASDAIQPSHSLSPSSLLALNLYQHQGLFQWVGSSNQVAKVLELQL